MPNNETFILDGERCKMETVPLLSLDQNGLESLSRDRLLSLTLDEMRAVQNYYRASGREPTDVELETIAQTWSEHCKHKTFRGVIEYSEQDGENSGSRIYDDLFKETIGRATQELNKPFCLSVFEDNAGVISFDKKWGIAFKVETHNHPSALEPYGGAGTGIGGVIRDILGVGLGAKPVLNTDVFCVGNFGTKTGQESGMLPPGRVLSGVIAGVRDYGNRMGIPTGNGAVVFHEDYLANPLVFCGTVGLIPRDKIHKKVFPGDQIVSIGGRTGRDGIHGATFSSLALEKGISASVVQIGNAIVEKKTADVILQARDLRLYSAITDCGAGGFSSAVGELAAECGARVTLEKVPLKYPGLAPWEIWVSESQERMVLSVPQKNLKKFEEICEIEDVECSVIGEFGNDGRLAVFFENETVCDLDGAFLHHGIPRQKKSAWWKRPSPDLSERIGNKFKKTQMESVLKKLLGHPNIGSKRWVVRQYDHEVQGGSVIKPFVGSDYEGPSDACVYRPRLDSWQGFVASSAINPLYGEQDPYWMAANMIDEALRNLVAVGGDIRHCAILDNFCWGDVNQGQILGSLVRCAQGCYDFSKGFGVPFISGKDSLNNTWRDSAGNISSIPGTLLISAVGVIKDARHCVTMDFKSPGNIIAVLGRTNDELGGSHFNQVMGLSGGEVPKVDAKVSSKSMAALHQLVRKGIVRSCHDISEGGLAVSLSEMCMAGGLGAEINLSLLQKEDRDRFKNQAETTLLFSESASRWVIEIELKNLARVRKAFSSLPFWVIGKVQKNPVFKINSVKNIIHMKVAQLKKNWSSFSDRQ